MKRSLWVVTFVGIAACVALSMQRMEAQSGPYNLFADGPVKLSVSTSSGQVLTSLEIPAGVTLSVSAPNASGTLATTADGHELPSTFTGDVSIRTRLRSEITPGSMRDQMLSSPLRMDVKDAVVVVTRQP